MNYLIPGGEYLKRQPNFKLVGQEDNLKRMTTVLMRAKAASILLVSPGGAGATALCMGLQASKEDENSPFDIVSKRFFWLDSDGLFSSGDSSKINEAFQRIATILKNTAETVLVIEDAKDFLEGSRNTGNTHFINTLNSLVKNNETRVIFEVRDDDIEYVLRSHSDMKECYTLIDLSEPVGEALKKIIESSSNRLFEHHSIVISQDAQDAAVELTNKYRTKDASLNRAQPERAINLIDRALATYRLDAHKNTPPELSDKIKKLYHDQREGELVIIGLEDEIIAQKELENSRLSDASSDTEKHISFDNIATKGGLDSEAVRSIKAKIKIYQDAVSENKKEFDKIVSEANKSLLLTREHILSEFSRLSGIPANKLNEDEREKLKNLESTIKQRIFGQDQGVEKIVNAIKVARIKQRTNGKPQASFLILGPSGVGKTEVSKALAAALLDDESALTRFDMSEFKEKHAVATLIGAPPGYEGFEMGGILTNAMRKNPHRVLLFDEIEKAHDSIFDIFLQILSDGRLTDTHGRVVSFSESIIIMTTNIGQEELLDPSLTKEMAHERAIQILDGRYRSEFLNRFSGRQGILCFDKLELETIIKIVKKTIKELNIAYSQNNIQIQFDDESLSKFCEDHYDPKIGARGLPGYIEANVEPIITNIILDNPEFDGVIKLVYDSTNRNFKTEMVKNV
jgi:ATP-dependent Clp protease ATP-binding subunit ClpB